MNAHTFPTADPVHAAIQASAAADAFMDEHPDVAFAEPYLRGDQWRYRLIIVRDGDEYEGSGHTMKWAYFVADSKAAPARARAAQARLNPAARDLIAALDRGFGDAARQFGRME